MTVGYEKDRIQQVSIKYPNRMDATFKLGWIGKEKIRKLNFYFSNNQQIYCNLSNSTIRIFNPPDNVKNIECKLKQEPLKEELSVFLNAVNGSINWYPDGLVGARIVKVA